MMSTNNDTAYQHLRDYMVRSQIESRGVRDQRVIEAMKKVPRHIFVPDQLRRFAYDDSPISIGHGQTISQPYIVAFMTELLRPKPYHKVLDIGTGSGYQAAVLAEIVGIVHTIEIVPELKAQAETILKRLGYANIISHAGDGYFGWSEDAPFDGILVAAAPEKVPEPLLDQLAEGGRLVIPVGDTFQFLEVYTREQNQIRRERNIAVRFVPMTGTAEES